MDNYGQLREKMLRIGMWLFLFAGAVSAFNILFLPFARENYHYSWFPMASVCFLMLLVIRWTNQRIDSLGETKAGRWCSYLVPLYLTSMMLIYLLVGYWMEYTPSGDNFMLYRASQKLARDNQFDVGSDFILYFCRFSNQWGFLLLLTGFYKILFFFDVTNTFYPLVVLQSLLYLCAFCSLLQLTKRYGGNRCKLRMLLLLFFCFPIYLAAGVLYTDTFSLPFLILTLSAGTRVLDLDEQHKVRWMVFSSVLALLGGQIKMTVVIALIAILITAFLKIKPKQAFIFLLIAGGIVIGGTKAIHEYTLDTYLDRDIYNQENTPLIHWVMMSIPDKNNPYGGYSQDYAETWGMMDEGASHEEVMESIYRRMKDKIYTLRYPNRLVLAMFRKNSAVTGDGSFGMTEMLDDGPVRYNWLSDIVLENGRFYSIYMSVTTGIWMADLLLSLYACLIEARRKETGKAVLYIACFGILLFLMFWEARSRYIFSFIPVFLLSAAAVPECELQNRQ